MTNDKSCTLLSTSLCYFVWHSFLAEAKFQHVSCFSTSQYLIHSIPTDSIRNYPWVVFFNIQCCSLDSWFLRRVCRVVGSSDFTPTCSWYMQSVGRLWILLPLGTWSSAFLHCELLCCHLDGPQSRVAGHKLRRFVEESLATSQECCNWKTEILQYKYFIHVHDC